jgi:hypothetical protein
MTLKIIRIKQVDNDSRSSCSFEKNEKEEEKLA